MFVLALSVSAFVPPVSAEETEATTQVELTGQLIELSSTDAPTTIIVRENPTGTYTDHTVNILTTTSIQGPGMEDWITGDTVSLFGTENQNTLVIDAKRIRNLSIAATQRGLNGWITAIDASASTMTVQWAGVDHVVHVLSTTRMVVPPKNPATLADFLVGDRVRLRVDSTRTNATIIVALRRGDEIFLKARTRPFNGELVEIDETHETMTVRLGENGNLRRDDVNNLVGIPGELVTVTWDENTKFVRRYSGKTTSDELVPGDQLFIVGRVDDDGTILARLIRDNDIFRKGVARELGRIDGIDLAANRLTVTVRRIGVWTVTYTDATEIRKNGKNATEAAFEVGDIIRVEGTANTTTKTVAATRIAVKGALLFPLRRERPLRDIVQHRMRHAAGQESDDDILSHQESEDAAEHQSEDEERAMEQEFEDELDGAGTR